jgi:ferredoxin
VPDDVKRLPQNCEGKYYTTELCDGCAYCASVAPENFDFERTTNTYYVCRQPETPEEEEYIVEAAEDCPVDAIRINGPKTKTVPVQD